MRMAWPWAATASTVWSVPGPPCTTSSTIGTPLADVYVDSRLARNWTSPPHALGATSPLSQSTKCVWYGLSGAPSWLAGSVHTYVVCAPRRLPSSAARPLTQPYETTPISGTSTA